MQFNLNKGGKLGKYFYTDNSVEYGPFEISDLLEQINKDTLVYFEGINWTKASEIPELSKYFNSSQEKIVETIIEQNETSPQKRSFLVPVLLIIIIAGIFFWYNNEKEKRSSAELAQMQKLQEDSIAAIRTQEQLRIQDSVLSASAAILDSARLIKLNIDYSVGIERVKSLLKAYFNDMSNRTTSMSPYFADTVFNYLNSSNIAVFDLERDLNQYNENNQNIINKFQLQDSTLIFRSMEGIYGVYNFNLYHLNQDNASENPPQYFNVSASITINPSFKIVSYNWIEQQQIDSVSVAQIN